MNCAYCERPLICESCQAEFRPLDPDAYQDLSTRSAAVACPACGAVLVCHWCKTPYDGSGSEEAEDD